MRTQCSNCKTKSSIQPVGDGCHTCLSGIMRVVKEESKSSRGYSMFGGRSGCISVRDMKLPPSEIHRLNE